MSIFQQRNGSSRMKSTGEYFKKRGDTHMQLSMIRELSMALNIDSDAAGFWNNVRYLFKTDDEVRSLLHECTGKSRREVDKYITKVRNEKIKKHRFLSLNDFVSSFNADKIAALERMFQEPIDISKLSKLTTSDPTRIFTIHSSLPLAVWFMSFVIYL